MSIAFTADQLILAKIWAQQNCGTDDPVDLFAWKLLDMQRQQSARSALYHSRQAADLSAAMEEVEANFEVSDLGDGDDKTPF